MAPGAKGLGRFDAPLFAEQIAQLGWNVLREDLSLPAAVLYEKKIASNLVWMQRFARAYTVKLAPHGKTTMAPKLFQRQMEAGAWGITLATAVQTRVAYEHGVPRVLMANELVGRENMAIISRLIEDPRFEFFCLVDSAPQVNALSEFFGSRGQKLNVLLELGVIGGRSGIRDEEQLDHLLNVLQSVRERIVVCGVEVYEGILNDEDSVRKFLRRAVEVTTKLLKEQRFDRSPILLSGAGSCWYDTVAEVFSKIDVREPIDIVLRPGCYL